MLVFRHPQALLHQRAVHEHWQLVQQVEQQLLALCGHNIVSARQRVSVCGGVGWA